MNCRTCPRAADRHCDCTFPPITVHYKTCNQPECCDTVCGKTTWVWRNLVSQLKSGTFSRDSPRLQCEMRNKWKLNDWLRIWVLCALPDKYFFKEVHRWSLCFVLNCSFTKNIYIYQSSLSYHIAKMSSVLADLKFFCHLVVKKQITANNESSGSAEIFVRFMCNCISGIFEQ